MTDFRALCAELVEKVEFTWGSGIPEDVKELLNRARSALADEPASVVSEPSDEEIMELWHGSDWYNEGATLREFLSITRAVLARWGRLVPAPVPLSERLPEPEDCSSDGKCWWFCFECPGEHSYWIFAKEVYCAPTYWLPAHALPLPDTND